MKKKWFVREFLWSRPEEIVTFLNDNDLRPEEVLILPMPAPSKTRVIYFREKEVE